MVKKNAEKDVGFVRQFNELKKKHPDAVCFSVRVTSTKCIRKMHSRHR